MLIWMQMSWLITLAGALICCSAQNISLFSFNKQTQNISENYRRKVSIAVLSTVLKRFAAGESPLTVAQIASRYDIPSRLAANITERLLNCGLLVRVAPLGETEISDDLPIQPSLSIDHYTVSFVIDTLRNHGEDNFIPGFDKEFPEVVKVCDEIYRQISSAEGKTLLTDL